MANDTEPTLQRDRSNELLTCSDVSKLLSVSPRWVWAQASQGKLPRIRLGKTLVRFTREDVDRLIERSREDVSA